MCKVGRHDPEPVVATILTDIVKDFGDMIATKLEMKLDAAGASGDLDKTVSVIHVLLGKYEGKTLGNARAAARQSDAEFDHLAVASARALAGRDPIVGGTHGRERERGGDRDDYIPPVWTVGKHELCDLCTRADRKHLRKHCPDSATPGVDPRRQALRDKRDKEKSDKKKKKGAARMAGAGTSGDGTIEDDDSDDDSDCSDCSDQSVYDDEQAVSVAALAADVTLASLFSDGSPNTLDVSAHGSARVAHSWLKSQRPGDLAEHADTQMAASRSSNAPTTNALRDGTPLAAAAPPGDITSPTAPVYPPVAPFTPVQQPPQPPSLHSVLLDDARGCVTPLRREDARRLIDELDPKLSPLSTMQSVARAAELSEVRLGCGPPSAGSTVNRTKAHVLADMRAAVGLSPPAVPMGIPMQTEGGDGSSQTLQRPAPPPALPPPPQMPDAPPPPQMPDAQAGRRDGSEPTSFGLTGFEARGGAEIAGSQIVADQHGELATCHIVRLADGGTLRATCPLAGPYHHRHRSTARLSLPRRRLRRHAGLGNDRWDGHRHHEDCKCRHRAAAAAAAPHLRVAGSTAVQYASPPWPSSPTS